MIKAVTFYQFQKKAERYFPYRWQANLYAFWMNLTNPWSHTHVWPPR